MCKGGLEHEHTLYPVETSAVLEKRAKWLATGGKLRGGVIGSHKSPTRPNSFVCRAAVQSSTRSGICCIASDSLVVGDGRSHQ